MDRQILENRAFSRSIEAANEGGKTRIPAVNEAVSALYSKLPAVIWKGRRSLWMQDGLLR